MPSFSRCKTAWKPSPSTSSGSRVSIPHQTSVVTAQQSQSLRKPTLSRQIHRFPPLGILHPRIRPSLQQEPHMRRPPPLHRGMQRRPKAHRRIRAEEVGIPLPSSQIDGHLGLVQQPCRTFQGPRPSRPWPWRRVARTRGLVERVGTAEVGAVGA